METYFIVMINKAGAVCASNASNTVFELSEKVPVAFAADPKSEFPWKECISILRDEFNGVQHRKIDDYVYDLEEIINAHQSIDEWKDWMDSKEEKDRTVFVVGFGKDDIFPRYIKAVLSLDEDAFLLSWDENDKTEISHNNRADICWLGDFRIIEPVIYGIHGDSLMSTMDSLTQNNDDILGELNIGEDIANSIRDDINEILLDAIAMAERKQSDMLKTGIETYSIENMVSSVEMMINTNTILSNLTGENTDYLKEIIVLQIPEGVTWCLHMTD